MEYSNYQLAVFDWLKDGGDGISEACAGSGKTFVLTEMNRRLPPVVSRQAFAFNSHIAEAFTERGLPGVTANAFGWRALRAQLGQIELVKQWKTSNIIRGILPDEFRIPWGRSISQLVSLGKANLMFTPAEFDSGIERLVDAAGVELPLFKDGQEEVWRSALVKAYGESICNIRQMDFDDQIFQACRLGVVVPRYDMVMVDETQDYAPMTIALMQMAARDRMYWVGDSYQAIYRFRGADPLVMKGIRGKGLPLSYCYRCGSDIVTHAAQWVPPGHILPAPGCGTGEVLWIDEHDFDPEIGSMVLCRMTAPLVKSALAMIKRGRKAYVKGRDLGKGLCDLIDTLTQGSNVSCLMLETLLSGYKESQCERLRQLGRDDSYVTDRVEAIQYFCDLGWSRDVKGRISQVFAEDGDGVMHSTIHRSKGSEADVVYCIRPEKLPHKKGDPDEERRLQYVQATRAKVKLVYVRSDKGSGRVE